MRVFFVSPITGRLNTPVLSLGLVLVSPVDQADTLDSRLRPTVKDSR